MNENENIDIESELDHQLEINTPSIGIPIHTKYRIVRRERCKSRAWGKWCYNCHQQIAYEIEKCVHCGARNGKRGFNSIPVIDRKDEEDYDNRPMPHGYQKVSPHRIIDIQINGKNCYRCNAKLRFEDKRCGWCRTYNGRYGYEETPERRLENATKKSMSLMRICVI